MVIVVVVLVVVAVVVVFDVVVSDIVVFVDGLLMLSSPLIMFLVLFVDQRFRYD